MNEDLYDGYGIPIWTHTDEDCTEMMKDILRASDFSSMAGNDLGLLEEFAPKLFNTCKTDTFYAMQIFVMIVNGYRMNKIKWDKETKRREARQFANKNQKDKTEKLKKKINEIKDLIDEDYIPKIHLDWLNGMLDDSYSVQHYRIKNSHIEKQAVKSYLKRLNLPKKTNEIEEFIEKLD